MQDLRIQRVKVLMMLYTSNYFVKVRQKQLLDHTYSLSRDQAFDYMTEFKKRLSDKVGIKCTMDILLPTDDDNANIIIEHNGIIKKLMKEAEKLELDTYHFIKQTDAFLNPSLTSINGVFVAGAACGPKDIPDSILSAGCAASEVAAYLTTQKNKS